MNPRHFHRLDSQGRCWIDFPDFQDWTSRWGFWTLRLDFWTSRLDFLDFRVSQERFWKHFRRPKCAQIQTFTENVFFPKNAQNIAPASKSQNFSCQFAISQKKPKVSQNVPEARQDDPKGEQNCQKIQKVGSLSYANLFWFLLS